MGSGRYEGAGPAVAGCNCGLDVLEERLKDQVMKRLDPPRPDPPLTSPLVPAMDPAGCADSGSVQADTMTARIWFTWLRRRWRPR